MTTEDNDNKKPNLKAVAEHKKKVEELTTELRDLVLSKKELHDGVVIDALLTMLFTFLNLRFGSDVQGFYKSVDTVCKQLKTHYQKFLTRAASDDSTK